MGLKDVIAVITKQTHACVKVTTPKGTGRTNLPVELRGKLAAADAHDAHYEAVSITLKRLYPGDGYQTNICLRMPGDPRSLIWIMERKENEK